MSDRGWYRVHRSVVDHPILSGDPACRTWAWLDLVGLAAHESTRRRFEHDVIPLERGELVASVRYLGRRWKWDKSKAERFLAMLQSETMIKTVRETARGTVYLIVNYDSYQSEEDGARDTQQDDSQDKQRTGQSARQVADRMRTGLSDSSVSTYGVSENGGNREIETASETKTRSLRKEVTDMDDPTFSTAWALYPKRAGGNPRAKAVAAWNTRVKEGVDPLALVDAVRRYAAYVRASGKEGTEYVQQAATFFGPSGRWADSYEAAPSQGGPGRIHLRPEDLPQEPERAPQKTRMQIEHEERVQRRATSGI